MQKIPFKKLSSVHKDFKINDARQLVGDEEGLYFANYQKASEYVAQRILEQIGKVKVLELCCGIGGMTVFLAQVLPHVYAVDLNTVRLEAAAINAKTFGVSEKITFIQQNVLDEELLTTMKRNNVEAVITDVEWRATATDSWNTYTPHLSETIPSSTALFEKASTLVSPNIMMHMPAIIPYDDLRSLGQCEIQQCIYKNDVKFLNVYYGKLATQEESRLMMD